MSTDDLIKTIEEEEYILPKDILKNTSEDQLIKELEEIFEKYQKKIEEEKSFRSKYTELVNYVFFLNLSRSESKKKQHPLNENIVNYLLNFREAV